MTFAAPADYPADLDEIVTLPNRTRVRIRPLRTCEEAPVRELYARLSPRSRYLRFFSPMPYLPDSVLRLLVSVDYRQRLALVVQRDTNPNGEVIGLGSFGATEDGSAEVALVVRDDWQRQRIGTELAIRVLDAAAARGFHRFVAHVLLGNEPIRKIIRRTGAILSAITADGVTEFVFVRRHNPLSSGGAAVG